MKLTFTRASGSADFNFRYSSGTEFEAQKRSRLLLGFFEEDTSPGTSVSSSRPLDLSQPRALYIIINNLANLVDTSNHKTTLYIPLSADVGQVQQWNENDTTSPVIFDLGRESSHFIDVRFVDSSAAEVLTINCEWEMQIEKVCG